ncbi:MAG: hypothetical protein Q8P80_05040 [Candidatus Levybacteria bacterium]|nr:hypothetical protein [Candidatus Levybacteria bacterium]
MSAERTRPGKESKAPHRLRNLTTLNVQEKDDLAKTLEKSQGTAQLWIHTHFRRASRYEIGMDRLIKNTSDNIPVIALIDSPSLNISIYRRHYAKANTKKIYYIETHPWDSTPCVYEKPRTVEEDKKNWDKFAEFLKGFGVKRIIASGMYLSDNEDPEFRGCVGFTIHALGQRGIIPFLSKITSPYVKNSSGSKIKKLSKVENRNLIPVS